MIFLVVLLLLRLLGEAAKVYRLLVVFHGKFVGLNGSKKDDFPAPEKLATYIPLFRLTDSYTIDVIILNFFVCSFKTI